MSDEETSEELSVRCEISDDGRTMSFIKKATGEVICQIAVMYGLNLNELKPEQLEELVAGILNQIPEDEGTPENPLITSFAVVPVEPE